MKKYEINDLLPLSIYDLRVVGRGVGVKSPTSMKRNDLIKNIIAICSGEQEPNQRSNRGRPAKNSNTSEKFRSVIEGADNEAQYIAYVGENGDELADQFCEENREDFYDEASLVKRGGVLDVLPDGYGFLRSGFKPSESDIYISNSQIKRFLLKNGDLVTGSVTGTNNRKYPALVKVEDVNGLDPESIKGRIAFENLTPIYPKEVFSLSRGSGEDSSMRLLDLIAPIAKGQRGLIVSPARAGKTTLLKKIANAIVKSDPHIKLFILLIDGRPEEVTDFQRNVDAEIVCSPFDEQPQRHVEAAEFVLERAKRQVECGQDVVILLDSLTRLARAYNIVSPTSSGILTNGGLDLGTLFYPKRFFGSARCAEQGGSLTILATAFANDRSKMDEVILEEFKDTANMELYLSREAAERQLYPTVDVQASFSRKGDLQCDIAEEAKMEKLKKQLSGKSACTALDHLLKLIASTDNNQQLLDRL